jgi:alpha-ribazole phosphatase
MRLYLVRHPKPLVDSGVCYGASDVACAASELDAAALALRDALPKGLEIISSPLQRCEHLAQYLQRLESNLTYKTDVRLAEMNFGAWEMQRWDSVSPEELKAWTDDFAFYRCGGSGESTGQFVRRVAQRLMETAQAGQDQIWITHAGVIRALQWLQTQPLCQITEGLIELATVQARRPETLFEFRGERLSLWLDQLHARDWPQSALAWCQVQPWDWPLDWPKAQALQESPEG